MSPFAFIIEHVFGENDEADRSATVADLRRRLGSMGTGVVWPGGFGAGPVSSTRARPAPGDTGDDAVLAVPAPFADVLPAGGVPRGSVVTVGSAAPGGGATSLLLALMAAPRGAWCAVIGMPDLGVLAAAEMGVDLSRLGLIPDPGPDPLQVISVLADGVDVIATASPLSPMGSDAGRAVGLPPARQRVLTGRLRQGGATLLVAGSWPGADLAFSVCEVRWSGIGEGHGRLRDREMDVEIGGRRAGAASGARVTLALRAGQGFVIVGAADTAEQPDAAPLHPRIRADVG